MVTFCASCWPRERESMGHAPILSPACMLTLPWFLFNSQEAMTCSSKITKGQRKGEGEKQLGNRTRIPFSPKKLKVVMFQQWFSYPLWPAKCYRYIQLYPPSWFCILACLCQDTEAMVGGVQFCCATLVLDTSEVKNGSCVWKKVTVKDNARYIDC